MSRRHIFSSTSANFKINLLDGFPIITTRLTNLYVEPCSSCLVLGIYFCAVFFATIFDLLDFCSVNLIDCICKASQKSAEIPRNIPSYFTPAKNAKFTNGNNNKLLDLDQLVIDHRLLGKKFFGIFSLNR